MFIYLFLGKCDANRCFEMFYSFDLVGMNLILEIRFKIINLFMKLAEDLFLFI